jgi:hypothetical protein
MTQFYRVPISSYFQQEKTLRLPQRVQDGGMVPDLSRITVNTAYFGIYRVTLSFNDGMYLADFFQKAAYDQGNCVLHLFHPHVIVSLARHLLLVSQ